jgi:hypothetical protein
MTQTPLVLYHFTCRLCWHFIKQDGISKGEVPISRTKRLQHPNLTSNPEPLAQKWENGPGANNVAVRISVEIPPGDQKLISWRDFAERHHIDRRWYRDLDRSGGWEARNWWIYEGVIPPGWFRKVDFLDDGVTSGFEKRLLAEAEKSVSFDEFLERMGARDENGIVFPIDPLWENIGS